MKNQERSGGGAGLLNIFIDAHACSVYQALQSQMLKKIKNLKKKWGKKSEEGWLVHKVGQYKRVEQVSSEEKTKQKKEHPGRALRTSYCFQWWKPKSRIDPGSRLG